MIKILADSASDITKSEAEALNIEMIPMPIRIGDKDYMDGVDLSHREFFEKLIESDDFPVTSQINEYRFAEKFGEMTANGDEVIAIVLSSALSETYTRAESAAKAFGGKVTVVDSLNASLGERILCDYAIGLVQKGLSKEEVVAHLEEAKHRIKLLALLDTLTYLKKGGRISSAVAFAGEILSVKPVISLVEGKIKLMGKAIGSRKGTNLLNRLVEQSGGIDFDMPYSLAYSGLGDEVLKKYIADSETLWKGRVEYLPSYMIGSTIGTHIGPGAIAVAFFGKKE